MPAASRVLVLNGPNLNLLGLRQPELYGSATLADVEHLAREIAVELGAPGAEVTVEFTQSNHEGVLIDAIHAARDSADAIVINPGGLSSTSVALLDALLAFDGPVAEVHVTNIHRRESFRHPSLVSQRADLVIAGAGIAGYGYALRHVIGERG